MAATVNRNFNTFITELKDKLDELYDEKIRDVETPRTADLARYNQGRTLLRACTCYRNTTGRSVTLVIKSSRIKSFFGVKDITIPDFPKKIIDDIFPRFGILISTTSPYEITGTIEEKRSDILLFTISQKIHDLISKGKSSTKLEELYKILLNKATTNIKTAKIVLREKNNDGDIVYNAYEIEVNEAKIRDIENKCGIKIDTTGTDSLIPLIDISDDEDMKFVKPISEQTYNRLVTNAAAADIILNPAFTSVTLDATEHTKDEFRDDFSSIIATSGNSIIKELYDAFINNSNTAATNQTYSIEFINNIDTIKDSSGNLLKRKYKFNINRAAIDKLENYLTNPATATVVKDMFKDLTYQPNSIQINIDLSTVAPADYENWVRNTMMSGVDGATEFKNKILSDNISITPPGTTIPLTYRKPAPHEIGQTPIVFTDSSTGRKYKYEFVYATPADQETAYKRYMNGYNAWITTNHLEAIGTRDISVEKLREVLAPDKRKYIYGYNASFDTIIDELILLLADKNIIPDAIPYKDTNYKFNITTNKVVEESYLAGKLSIRLREIACRRFERRTGTTVENALKTIYGHASKTAGIFKCDRNYYIKEQIAARLSNAPAGSEEESLLNRLNAIFGTDERDFHDSNVTIFVGAVVPKSQEDEFINCIMRLNKIGKGIEKIYPVKIDGTKPDPRRGIDHNYEREMQQVYSKFGINYPDRRAEKKSTKERTIYPHENLTWENGIPDFTDDRTKLDPRFAVYNRYYNQQVKGKKITFLRKVTGKTNIIVADEKDKHRNEIIRAILDRDKTDGILENYDALGKGFVERLAINTLISTVCLIAIPSVTIGGAALILAGTQGASSLAGWISRVRQTLLTNRVNDATDIYNQIQQRYIQWRGYSTATDPDDIREKNRLTKEIKDLYKKFAKAVKKVPRAQQNADKIREINQAFHAATSGTPTIPLP